MEVCGISLGGGRYLHAASSDKVLPLRVYGTSGSTIKSDIEELTGVNPGSNSVYSKETGRVAVTPEIYTSAWCCADGGASGASDGEGVLICLIVIAIIMAVIAIVWSIIMLAFSIMTVGAFLKRRYRTLLIVEKENHEFLGKLAVMLTRQGGVLEYEFGQSDYDQWARDTFSLFRQLKIIRQVSLFFGFWWGVIEVIYKANNLLTGANYDLWPLRYIMIVIFVPLLLYSPILEGRFRNAFDKGEELVMRLVNNNPAFSPSQPLIFEEPPIEVGKISPSSRKLKESGENSGQDIM